MRVAISGGGIGGLATAAAFGHRGWDVTVYEKQSELRTVGSGIYIWENGCRVLEALGAYEVAAEGAFHGRAFEHRDQNNSFVDALELPEGSRLITVPRRQLLEALRQACVKAGVEIRTGVETVGATSRGELLFASGERSQNDLVVGVDGIWSKVRTSVGIESNHQVTREGCLRTIVPRERWDFGPDDGDKYIENWNGTRRLLVTPISETQIYLALTCPQDDLAGKQIPVDRELWMNAFPAWRHLTERIGPDVTWGRYSIIECSSWSSGRAAIVGDAAHAQPPNLGQGGGMAMQNGLALAVFMEKVADRRDIPDQLWDWECTVRPLTDHCQKWSSLYGEVTYLADHVRAQVFGGAANSSWVAEQLMLAACSEPLGTSVPAREASRVG